MKTVISFVFISGFSVFLVGCGGGSSTNTGSPNTQFQSSAYTLPPAIPSVPDQAGR